LPAGRRKTDPLPSALDEGCSKARLQGRNLGAERWLSDVTKLGSAREMTRVGDGGQITKLLQGGHRPLAVIIFVLCQTWDGGMLGAIAPSIDYFYCGPTPYQLDAMEFRGHLYANGGPIRPTLSQIVQTDHQG
jgi:hypothetical protein